MNIGLLKINGDKIGVRMDTWELVEIYIKIVKLVVNYSILKKLFVMYMVVYNVLVQLHVQNVKMMTQKSLMVYVDVKILNILWLKVDIVLLVDQLDV